MKDFERKHRAALGWQMLDRRPQELRALISESLRLRRRTGYDAQVPHIPHRIGLRHLLVPARIDREIASGGEEICTRDFDLIPVLVGPKKCLLDDLVGFLRRADEIAHIATERRLCLGEETA